METGMTNTETISVTQELTAKAMGSGELEVLATPAMCALMEKASMNLVSPYLEEGQTTVGTALNIKHTAATPVGMEIKAESRLSEIDGRRLVFELRAYDGTGEIGTGTHERFIVNASKFMNKTKSKLEEKNRG